MSTQISTPGTTITSTAATFIDLFSRFIVNLPAEEQRDENRLFYHLELAYYFWVDHYKGDAKWGVSAFIGEMKQHTSSFFSNGMRRLFRSLSLPDRYQHYLNNYKYRIPVCGVVLRMGDYVLLVKNQSSNKWGFPKGKQNKGEKAIDCAFRECIEETSLDLTATSAENVSERIYRHADIYPRPQREGQGQDWKSRSKSKSKSKSRSTSRSNKPENVCDTTFTLFTVEKPLDEALLNREFVPENKTEISEIKWFLVSELKQHGDISRLTSVVFSS